MGIKTTLKIYHNGQDSEEKVAKIIALSKDKNIESLIINILEDKFTGTRLLEMSNKLNINLKDLANTNCKFYKENLKSSTFDEADWIRILIENPQVIRVPIIETKEEAIIIEDPREILNIPSIGQNIDGYNHNNK